MMDLNDPKYSSLINFAEIQFQEKKDWENVRKLDYFPSGNSLEEKLNIISPLYIQNGEIITAELWNEIIDYLSKRDEDVKVTKLGKRTRNDAIIPSDKYSTWQLYREQLINQSWSKESILSIEKSSFEVLQNLSMDTSKDGPVKGLVVGNVQSGKTANMAGLIAMAADNGFNFFIILSGVIENLRKQTANRLYNDLGTSGKGNLKWQLVDNPSLRNKSPDYNISKYDLSSNAKNRYFTVCLKNSTRLQNLINWLYSDKNKAKQLKVLVIDDEADQASINTHKIEEDQTRINGLIRNLVNTYNIKGMNYIAYTATPYANVLNEVDEDSLYPKDFIMLLEPASDYIGPQEIFGLQVPEMNPKIDIVRQIKDSEAQTLRDMQEEGALTGLPNSLRKALHWFLITVAALREMDYKKPISMLVHTSFKINHHQNISRIIEKYLRYVKDNYKNVIVELQDLYENESLDFKRSHFIAGMTNYTQKDKVPEYPEWKKVEKYINRIMKLDSDEFISRIPIGVEGQPKYHKGIHLVIDNSQSKAENQIARLVYPEGNQTIAPAFIVVGGNTLSRGLTIEGLTTTYFLRTTSQADTLMQMARWFGFRKGYEIFPRVWIENIAIQRYEFLSQINEELREEIKGYAINGLTPKEYAPHVRNSANNQFLRITSRNKMQSAIAADFDFSGFNSQTIYFENIKEVLESNLKITKDFLNSLPYPEVKTSHLIWRDIKTSKVKEFLTQYEVCDLDIKMSNLSALIEWAEKNVGSLANWNIIFSSVGNIQDTKVVSDDPDAWIIHGFKPKSAKRSRLRNRGSENQANIGVLRNPLDLLIDIEDLTKEEEKEMKVSAVRAIREKYGLGEVPQIIIYKIDKGQGENSYNKLSKHREPLNFSEDVIGINVMIPGHFKGGNMVTKISANIKVEVNDFDEKGLMEVES